MKRKVSLITFIVFSISATILTAYAHSGRTDANGGHYNRSTGEYHYHHGFPAHSHSNGCIYEWLPFVVFGIVLVVISAFVVWSVVCGKKEEKLRIQRELEEKRMLEEEQRSHRERLEKEKEARIQREIEEKRIFEEERKKYYEMYANKDVLILCGCPQGTYIGEDGLPTTNDSGKYGKYTVYTTQSLNKTYKYHLNYCCSGRLLVASNIVKHDGIEPCSRCAKGHYIDTSWYREYLRIMGIKKKYDIP